jgi:prepilin-type N-terminal cleavage/methylation domain-containing protein
MVVGMKHTGCRGYTLVELMIAMALVATVVGLVALGARLLVGRRSSAGHPGRGGGRVE